MERLTQKFFVNIAALLFGFEENSAFWVQDTLVLLSACPFHHLKK